MIAELAAINAGFAVFKTAIKNGKEITDIGKNLMSILSTKKNLEKKVEDQKNSGTFDPETMSEEFWALESLKQKEIEIKEMMIYCGRPGLWQDWEKFKNEAFDQKEESDAERLKRIRNQRRQREIKAEEDAKQIKIALGVFGFLVVVLCSVVWAKILLG